MVEGHRRTSHEHRSDLAGEYRWGDAGQNILLIVFVVGMVVDVFLVKISYWQGLVPWYYRIIPFAILFLIGIYFVQQAHKTIFGEERKQLMVISTGVFALLRHPMYFGSLMIYLSFVILSLSIIAFAVFVVAMIFYYYLAWYEERLLNAKLGVEYEKYKERVPMLFPKL